MRPSEFLSGLGFALILGACGPSNQAASDCDQKKNDCMKRCNVTDSDVERTHRADMSNTDADRRTLCEQSCDDACS